MIYIRTFAYNAEKTLERAIESILNQTYGEFTYYLLDNGSTDATREIVRKYAEKDKRICPFYSEKNFDKSINSEFWLLSQNLSEGDYMCFLDADDAYEPTFLEETVRFSTQHGLDIVACGTKFIDAITGLVCGERVLPHDYVIVDDKTFDWVFPEIHWNLRQVWGKLYTARAARARFDVNKPEWYPDAYGGDTVNVYECVKASERVGVCAKVLHSYTISGGSVSYKWIEGREKADFILFECAKELLMQKCGQVSARNLNFLYAVQFNALKDTLNVLYNSNLVAERKISIIKELFINPVTQQTFIEKDHVAEKSKTELLIELVCRVIEMAQDVNSESLEEMAEIFKKLNSNFLKVIPLEYLKWYIKNMPVLVRNIALGEYEYAMNNLIVNLYKNREISLEIEHPFVLGQMVSALSNEEKRYIFFSKQLILWCINNGKLDRAREELEEWEKIMPNDQDFINMSQMVKGRN